jgi:putative CocE/NonD family hydrolase
MFPRPLITRRRLSRLLAAFAVFGAARARTPNDAAEPFESVLDGDVRVRMRDGVGLATDVYRPARKGHAVAGRFPVILERTPYGRNATSFRDITAADPAPKSRARVAEYYVRHGYVVIFQDCRGCHDSEGRFVKYLNEGADGFDTCRWILAQPWSNERIGTMGLSYAAHTQVALACLNPPGLEAMYVDCGGFSNAYQDGIRQGGAFELKQVTWAYGLGLESPEVAKNPRLLAALKAVDLRAWFASMPWKRGHTPISLLPEYEDYVYEQWEHGNFDAFWKQIGIYAQGFYSRFSDAAMVHLSGWYDAYSRTATDNYVGLSKHGRGPVKLIMGPWTHGARSTPYAGDVDFGAGSTLDSDGGDIFARRLAWFDRYLKGMSEPDRQPSVRLFVMGGGSGHKTAEGRLDHGGRWRSESAWPIPAQPVPTMGGTVTSGEPLMRGGGYDQREGPSFYGSREPYLPVAARPDVLVFETNPLAEDVEVTGVIEANLWISSDSPDTDFTIKLMDVYPAGEDYPEGFALNLTDGILRCRYRDASLQQLMRAEVDTAADGVWNAVQTVITRSGTEERQPRTPEEWTTVRNAAITLVEATNLLIMEGRRVVATEFPAEAGGALDSVHIQALIAANRPAFDAFSAALRGAGVRAIAAIDARDPVALVTAGGEIDSVCEACHLTFWYPNQVIPALPDSTDIRLQAPSAAR